MGQGTLLFIDEIHRFNRSQQDSFLPVVEDGTVVLVGATTENPSFELNGALLSRAQVLVLRRLDDAALETLLERAEAHYGEKLPLTDDARASLRAMADGDGRYLLNLVEELSQREDGQAARLRRAWSPRCSSARRSTTRAARSITTSSPRCISRSAAPIPTRRSTGWRACWRAASSRSTSPAAWCARRSRISAWPIRRRCVQALAAKDVFDFLGSPEGEIALAQCVLYLASAPKSNAVYTALGAAKRAAQEHGSLMPPAHILNAPTKLMKNLGYGKGYEYDHDAEEGFSGQNYFPDAMARQQFYAPKETGFEREIAKRLEYWSKLRAKRSGRRRDAMRACCAGGGGWAARSASLLRYFVAGRDPAAAWCRFSLRHLRRQHHRRPC